MARPSPETSHPAGLTARLSYVPPSKQAQSRRLGFAILRRKRQILAIALLAVLPTALWNFYVTPCYTSSARIQIDPEPVKAPLYPSAEGNFRTDYYDFDSYFKTQLEILKSDRLSDLAASRLEAGPEVEKSVLEQRIRQYCKTAKRRLFGGAGTDPAKAFADGLVIDPVEKTRLVEIRYSSADPVFAAAAANAAAEEFIRLHRIEKEEAAEKTVRSLNDQLDALRIKVEQSEAGLIEYASQNGILDLVNEDQGTIRQKLEKLNEAIVQAEARFIARSANFDALKTASPADLPSSLRAGNAVIGELERRHAEVEQRISILTSQFDENWPELVQARKELSRIELQLVEEREAAYSRALHQAKMEFEAASRERRMLSKSLQGLQDAAGRLNQASVQYNKLKRDVDTNQQLHQALLQRLKEAGDSSGVGPGNIRMVQQAKPATVPSSPRTLANLTASLMLGFVLGLGWAFFSEHMDRSLKTVKDLEDYTGLPSLASLPLDDQIRRRIEPARERKLLAPVCSLDLHAPRSAAASSASSSARSQNQAFREACLQLRTSILLANPDRAPQTILMTSAIPLEGKTTVAAQLAGVLARADAHTILLDLDMRRPELSKRFGADGGHGGMSVFLSGNSPVVSDLVETDNPYLVLAPAGPRPPNPADLIGSERMKIAMNQLRKYFRFIVIDTPPILTVADALALAPLVDGVVLVVRAEQTPREIVSRAIAEMRRSGGRILGLVFNGVDSGSPDHYYAQKYYGYSNYVRASR